MSSSSTFIVLSGETVIGWSALEHGDPPMGMLLGDLHPSESYAEVGAVFRALYSANETDRPDIYRAIEDLQLRIETESGEIISDTLGILDPGDDLPEELPYVDARCLSADVYRRHFRHHIQAYDERFGGS